MENKKKDKDIRCIRDVTETGLSFLERRKNERKDEKEKGKKCFPQSRESYALETKREKKINFRSLSGLNYRDRF